MTTKESEARETIMYNPKDDDDDKSDDNEYDAEMSIFKELEEKIREDQWDTESWNQLIAETIKEGDKNKIRQIYEKFLQMYPTAGRYWKNYIEFEINNQNYEKVESLFNRCLAECLHIDLWKLYLNYNLKIKMENSIEEKINSFKFALDHIKYDISSTPIWVDYINYLKELPIKYFKSDSDKITRIRELYQDVITIPINNLENIWSEYTNWESSNNKLLADEKYFPKNTPKYNATRAAYRDKKTITESISKNLLAVPPGKGNHSMEKKQIHLWKKLIRNEKNNPQHLEVQQLKERVEFAYKQCLLCLTHFPEIWYEYANYFIELNAHEDVVRIFDLSLKNNIMNDSMLLHFSYADYLEQRNYKLEAIEVYKHLLQQKQHPLVWIQYMHFVERTFGIDHARKIFLFAIKSPSTSYHIYTASAMMEYYKNKDPDTARQVFEHGLKIYKDNVEYIIQYLKFLWNLNDYQNTRVLFEKILLDPSPEVSKIIWPLFLEFEYSCGTVITFTNIEKRKAEAFPSEDKSGIYTVVQRHRYQDLWPCDNFTLDSFESDDEEAEISTALASRKKEEISARYPRPDTNTMTPFRPEMSALTASLMGLPALVTPEGSPAIMNFEPDNSVISLPEALVNFIAALPLDNYMGPAPDVETTIKLIQDAVLHQAGGDSSLLGKRKDEFGANDDDQPLLKKPKRDIYRDRQHKAMLKKKLGSNV